MSLWSKVSRCLSPTYFPEYCEYDFFALPPPQKYLRLNEHYSKRENSQNLFSCQMMNATQLPRNITNEEKWSEFSATKMSRRTLRSTKFFPNISFKAFFQIPIYLLPLQCLLICPMLLHSTLKGVLSCTVYCYIMLAPPLAYTCNSTTYKMSVSGLDV